MCGKKGGLKLSITRAMVNKILHTCTHRAFHPMNSNASSRSGAPSNTADVGDDKDHQNPSNTVDRYPFV